MLGRSRLTAGACADDRIFVYEVAGLHHIDRTKQNNHEIRHSSTLLMPVPFGRMSEFMQRMNRLGVQIVSIRSLNGLAKVQNNAEAQHESDSKKKK